MAEAPHRPQGCDGGAGLGGVEPGRRALPAIGRAAAAAAVPGPAGDGVTGHVVSERGISDVGFQEAGVTAARLSVGIGMVAADVAGGPWCKP
ncbi:hypothetical protein ACIF8T_34565 [Streptomyces sp. NPDC085946]|uniref:hypothetical protein n=1 Tax=Streptomyces sp. NPDC085946 TaxID=3365744 RepID=UPI0037D43AD9